MVYLLGRENRNESLKRTAGLAFENVHILKTVATPEVLETERSLIITLRLRDYSSVIFFFKLLFSCFFHTVK